MVAAHRLTQPISTRQVMGVKKSLLLASMLATLSGCSLLGVHIGEDTGPEKGKTTSLPPLEVPPDLSVPDFDTRLSIPNEPVSETKIARAARRAAAGAEGGAADSTDEAAPSLDNPAPPRTLAATEPGKTSPTGPSLRVQQAGSSRWIEIGSSMSDLTPKLRNFLREEGYTLSRIDAKSGIIESGWRTNGPAGAEGETREKVRLKLQKETSAVTNVYVTQLLSRRTGDKKKSWQSVPTDGAQEQTLFDHLSAYLGGNTLPAPQQLASHPKPAPAFNTPAPAVSAAPVATLSATASSSNSATSNGTPSVSLQDVAGVPALVIQDDYTDAWNMTGNALNRSGLKVENRDRNRGLYFVRNVGKSSGPGVELQPGGKFQVHLLNQGHRTLITAHSAQDKGLAQISARAVLLRLKQALQNPAGTAAGTPSTAAQTSPGTG